MAGKLLKKELALCLHPTTPLMIALCAIVLVPNYPYTLIFFYLTLGVFFICLSGRENHDIIFSVTLPVSKREIVTARFLLVLLMELTQLLLTAVLIFLRGRLFPGGNAAGMDANLSLLGEGLCCFGVFHLVFFPSYYKNTDRVGISFLKSCIAMGLLTALDIVLTYTVPLFRDILDTADPAFLAEKFVFFFCCLLFCLASTWLALQISRRRFEKLDIR